MKILNIKALRGPNYWSAYRQRLIVMKVDLLESEDYPTNKIDGFADRLEALIPSLYTHRCSEKKPGGFFERVRQGTWMGHVVEHIALELQSLAGMPCGFGRTRSTGKRGEYNIVFAYEVESAGRYAAEAAVRIAHALESDIDYDIKKDIQELVRINKNEGLGPSTKAIVKEAILRNIPYKRLDNNSLIMLGYGKNQKIIRATMACTTSSIGVELASDKEDTKKMLSESFVPLPKGGLVYDKTELQKIIQEIGFPVVIKPVDGNHGRGVTTNINSIEDAGKAYQIAKEISSEILVEKFIQGIDYRFLVVNYKLVAVAKRMPAMVMGDDKSSIEQLIEKTNSDPNRGEGHEKVLTTIKIDQNTNSILLEKNLTLNSVLPLGEILFLKDTANISTGGTARDVTDVVHPHNVFLAERIARLMGLDICGIDIIARDINIPITEETGAVIEVNAGPGFRMHLSPSKGIARNVAASVIDMLFPKGAPSRIPLVAVTGTNGKTTTTRLIAHLAKNAGHKVGFTTTDGIYIQDHAVHHGDCSGPASAEVVLRDPLIDFAVLECARGGILRAGLGFDKCDISIITNITEDHLGLNDIHSIKELAKVKAVVAHSTADSGYAILNADDDLVYNIASDLDCNIALFSTDEKSSRIKTHCDNGGLAAIIEKGYFTICRGQWRTRIGKVKNIPLTMEGRAECMVKNILPAILVGAIRDFDLNVIKDALHSFIPGPSLTPGRMNVFKFNDFEFMVDYAHNTDGFIELAKFLRNTEASVKIGIVGCTGDRRDEDIINMGATAAQMFGQIIIRHDKDGRGRSDEEITQLIVQGIRKINPEMDLTIISDEKEAIQYAINIAPSKAFIVLCTDDIHGSINFLSEQMEKQVKPEQLENEADVNLMPAGIV